jgi:hypothetical protein
VQGQLQEQPLGVTVHTECACCGQPLTIELDSELNYTVQEGNAAPLVFVPLVNFNTLEDPSIIDAF